MQLRGQRPLPQPPGGQGPVGSMWETVWAWWQSPPEWASGPHEGASQAVQAPLPSEDTMGKRPSVSRKVGPPETHLLRGPGLECPPSVTLGVVSVVD